MAYVADGKDAWHARLEGEGGARPSADHVSPSSALASWTSVRTVNGAARAIVGPARRPFAVVGFTIAQGRINAINLIIDPDKLRGVPAGSDKPITRTGRLQKGDSCLR
jgi:hypothetical protein